MIARPAAGYGVVIVKTVRAMPTVKKQIVLSEDLDRDISEAATEQGTNQAEIFRKALMLYFVAREKKKTGLKLGFVKADQPLEIEVVGL